MVLRSTLCRELERLNWTLINLPKKKTCTVRFNLFTSLSDACKQRNQAASQSNARRSHLRSQLMYPTQARFLAGEHVEELPQHLLVGPLHAFSWDQPHHLDGPATCLAVRSCTRSQGASLTTSTVSSRD